MLNLPELANPVLSCEESKQQLNPYFLKFIECINGAWKQWSDYSLRHTMDNRARASMVNAAIVYRAKAAFAGLAPEVKFTATGNSFFLYIGDHIKIRFKKFTADGRYSNLMTGRQIALLQQQSNIPGVLPGTYLTVGYQLDKLEQNIQSRMVTLQVKKTIKYFIDLDEEVASISKVTAMPPMPIPAPAKRRVKPRKAKGHAAGTE
jgi:hypothetical protein